MAGLLDAARTLIGAARGNPEMKREFRRDAQAQHMLAAQPKAVRNLILEYGISKDARNPFGVLFKRVCDGFKSWTANSNDVNQAGLAELDMSDYPLSAPEHL